MGPKQIEKKAQRTVEVVQVPRAAYIEAVWSLPYSALREKAARGERGMSVFTIPDNLRRLNNGLDYSTWDPDTQTGEVVKLPPNVAFVRRGADAESDDKAFLYGQNW